MDPIVALAVLVCLVVAVQVVASAVVEDFIVTAVVEVMIARPAPWVLMSPTLWAKRTAPNLVSTGCGNVSTVESGTE